MDENHLSHSTWDCKYHVVFGSKYRTKQLYGDLRLELRDLFTRLALQKGCRIEEGHMMPDHVHMLISIPPKYSVAHIVGFLEGETALMGYNEKVVRRYIQKQKKADKASDFADLFKAGYLISLHRLIQFEY